MFSTHLLQDLVAAYDASIHLVYEELATELPRLAGFVAGDDLGVLLKEVQDLLCGRDLLTIEDASSRLGDPLLYQPHKVLQALQQTPGFRIGMLSQRFDDLPRLSAARLGYADQLSVSLFELLTGLFSFATRAPVQPLSCELDAAIAGAEDFLAQATNNFGRQRLGSAFFALLSRRERTLTPSLNKALSVGWWMLVCTTMLSTLSLRPRVPFNERASSTARSLSAATVCAPITFAQRMRVVSSGAPSR